VSIKTKADIDAASYEELLEVWRFSPISSPCFQGDIGQHFRDVIAQKRKACPDPVAVSKRIGWRS